MSVKMQPYQSNHPTGVVAYAEYRNGIIVQFQKGVYYFYSADKTGREHVNAMLEKATKGEGLSSYISQHRKEVWENYHATANSLSELLKKI
ncbi:hypothetical protein MUY27_08265 [Mucilaginibacter sp. RS28]|uniref:Uncharacterized protein n=1 Tax=Mucilaginibacter straminoryzae TaxID=2932774 RepID=A0A9X2B9F4_9SPHI|nr:hypothetical protein [Mucilaginibacter straminoryzae]MCJ8209700.1 hypothetical protein [Mucilaginibacter straminoryzae]